MTIELAFLSITTRWKPPFHPLKLIKGCKVNKEKLNAKIQRVIWRKMSGMPLFLHNHAYIPFDWVGTGKWAGVEVIQLVET